MQNENKNDKWHWMVKTRYWNWHIPDVGYPVLVIKALDLFHRMVAITCTVNLNFTARNTSLTLFLTGECWTVCVVDRPLFRPWLVFGAALALPLSVWRPKVRQPLFENRGSPPHRFLRTPRRSTCHFPKKNTSVKAFCCPCFSLIDCIISLASKGK